MVYPTFSGYEFCTRPTMYTFENKNTTGRFTATPPEPRHAGGWVAYYMELKFEADTLLTDTQYVDSSLKPPNIG